jgi:hypothetical protein
MLKEIKGKDGQHPVDMCLMGQGDLDNYVEFLRINGINSNEAIQPSQPYTFAVSTSDSNVDNLVTEGVVFASLDNQARYDLGILGGEAGVSLYGKGVSLYGTPVNLYE